MSLGVSLRARRRRPRISSRGAKSLSRAGSECQEHFGGAALVHRLVALGCLIEREGEVEDLARVDLAVPDQLDQRSMRSRQKSRQVNEFKTTQPSRAVLSRLSPFRTGLVTPA
jgi:hypothetical protein